MFFSSVASLHRELNPTLRDSSERVRQSTHSRRTLHAREDSGSDPEYVKRNIVRIPEVRVYFYRAL